MIQLMSSSIRLFHISFDLDESQLLPVVMEVSEVNLKCMELLDKANTTSYGNPSPVKVTLNVEKNDHLLL